jgi:hypothetical protein
MRIERCTYRPWFAVGSRTAGNNEKSQQSCSRGEEQQQRTPSQQHYEYESAAFLITAARTWTWTWTWTARDNGSSEIKLIDQPGNAPRDDPGRFGLLALDSDDLSTIAPPLEHATYDNDSNVNHDSDH